MTGRHTRHIVLTILAIAVASMPVFAEQALADLRARAEQGDADAQYTLALRYDYGEGVPQDYAEAARWYRLAAEQGDASAMTNLGIRYASGWGVPQDYVLAHMWRNLATFRLAGEELEQSVRTRDALASLMTSEDLSEAQRLASEWQATHPHEPSA